MAKKIPVGKSLFTLVDDDLYELLTRTRWHTCRGYARRWGNAKLGEDKKNLVFMHRYIMTLVEPIPKGRIIDHIDRNPLNNLRENLRIVTWSGNMINRPSWGEIPYKGVSIVNGKYRASIRDNGKFICIGNYSNAEDAARAYNEAAIRIQGVDFAVLNIIT